MLIFNSLSEPIILDDIFTPITTDHFWILDLEMLDFTLTPLYVLEEIVCPSIMVNIRGFEFPVPANWHMLVYDEETLQLDTVELSNLCGKEFVSLIYGPNLRAVLPGIVSVVDYTAEYHNVYPSLNKHQMLCHPIGPELWVNIAPTDSYNKYIKDKIIGDIIS